MTRAVAMGLLFLAPSCSGPEPRAVRVDLVTKGSCGSPLTYDVACLQALEVRMLDASGEEIERQCTSVRGRYATLQDMVSSNEVLEILEDVRAPSQAIIEIRGFHAVDRSGAPCDAVTNQDMILWGRSEPTALLDVETTAVSVRVECRPECDCAAILDSEPNCPLALQPGVCAPTAETTSCEKPCGSDSGCYESALVCSQNRCVATPRRMCAPCSSAADCDSGSCVDNPSAGDTFCALECPAGSDVSPCPAQMSCKRLDADPYSTVP